jgi:amino acid adenylation domain-containing protein/non-ribosomal peptide synthase protein (TIGR01720 family)
VTVDAADRENSALSDRLARLDSGQLTKLVLGLQQRIDDLRDAQVPIRSREPIAIVGLACRFPGAADANAFRALLEAGGNAIGPPPPGRPESADLPPGAYVADIDQFDAGFFGVRASEAAAMDPQHRMVLEVAWHALEDAGYAAAERRPRGCGIFIGLSTSDYEVRFRGATGHGVTPPAATGTARSVVAGRMAHLLDVTGPALAIDTACSSSLVAVHAACRSLRAGESDMAIAGGANALIEPDLSEGLAAAGMLSPTHACKVFDAAADGYVRGEGAGIVVLRRLADADAAGDRIRAVIRGSAVNHDGHASSLTAPNAAAQVAVIRAALADAGLAPGDVQAVECHGTGTPLGDPIEVEALAQAYGGGRTADLLLGAVKTNIGHLEAAAGIAGLIKLVLALEAGWLPATLHQVAPNPRIAWDRLPVHVVDRLTPWPAAQTRRTGLSSFGFSGTNAHVILEAAPAKAARGGAAPWLVLPLSGSDRDGLHRLAAAVADRLERAKIDPAAAAAAALAVGREHLVERAAVATSDAADLVAALRVVAADGTPRQGARGTAPAAAPKIAFLFTGQGSQWAGMGGDLYQRHPAFRATVDRCAAIVDPLIGASLTELMFGAGNDETLADTAAAQPALFVLEYALAEMIEGWGIAPTVMIGHSLGEWVAACRAGIFRLDDALRLVAERGRLMGSLPRDGAMAAVFASRESVSSLLDAEGGKIDIAACNAPDEVVVSGETADIAAACAALEAQGIGSQRLRTSHAFHSRLMEPIVDAFGAAVAKVTLSPPARPLVSNVTADTSAAFIDPGYWARHIRAPVRFGDGIAAVVQQGATVLVEIGPAPALIGLAMRSPAAAGKNLTLIPTLRRNHEVSTTLGHALAQLYVARAPLRWEAIYPHADRADLPGYPFADQRYWTPRPAQAAVARPDVAPEVRGEEGLVVVSATPVPAHTDLRTDVRGVLARALQLDSEMMDADRSFLELGVDSLALTEAVATIERRWKLAIPRRLLFETLATPQRLIAHVAQSAATSAAGMTPARAVATQAARPEPTTAPAPVGEALPHEAGETEPADLADFRRDYVQRTQASRRQRETYAGVLADSRAAAGFRPATADLLYPIVGERGAGSHVVDADGNDYVDVTMGFGVQLFGHKPVFVTDAIQHHIVERGLFIGPQAPLAGEVAERICRLTGNARAVFCNTGTEAVMTALRLARHVTGRMRVAMFTGSYHGHFDGTLASPSADGTAAPLTRGTPAGMVADMLVLDYGDPEGALEVLRREGETLAAVIVEPVQSRRPDRQPRAFLQQLRALTRALGIALVFDEVLLGFRVALGGAQAWASVQADVVTYGKIIGGGLPIGVVAGERRFLDAIDGGAGPRGDRTFFAGTFNKNPLTMAASHAVLTHLENVGPSLQEALNRRTADLAERLNAILAAAAPSMRVDAFASLFRFVGASDVFFYHLIRNGVYVWEGRTCFLSTAHDDADLDRIVEAVTTSVRAMQARGLLGPHRGAGPERMPTTAGQEALRMLAAFSPQTSAAYNQSLVLEFSGSLDVDALTQAVHEVVRRHEALRTTFADDGKSQFVRANLMPEVDRVDMQGTDDRAVRARIDAIAIEPFDLGEGPLVRARLIRLGPDRHRLVLVLPHIATDGWSMQVIAVELGEIYSARQSGTAPDLPAPVPYRGYVEHTRGRAERPGAKAYWIDQYQTVPPPLDLPADRPRPRLQTYGGACVRRRVPAALRDRLVARARASGCSLFSLCLAAYARLLAELSGQNDLAIAIFSAGQPEIAARALVGYCIATLPLRIRAPAEVTDEGLIAAVQSAVTDAMEHRDFPFSALLKALGLRRDPSRAPLATVSFNLDRLEAATHFAGLETTIEANAHGAVRWDLNWNVLSDAEGLLVEVNFNRDLFDAARIEKWAAAYAAIVERFTAGAARTALDAPVETLSARVAARAAAAASAIAVRDCEGAVSYATLDSMAAVLAYHLSQAGVGCGDAVAFRLARGRGPVVAMLAAMRLGAAFVPLDPEHPAAHHAFILADSGARALVVEPGAAVEEPSIPAVAWSQHDASDAAGASRPVAVGAEDIAYLLYTSGSTGRPKGVRVPHRAVAAYVTAMLERLALTEPTSFAIVTSFAADLGYTAVLGALWSGGTLHAIDSETARDPVALQAWITAAPVDCLKIVPTHLAALLEAPDAHRLLPRKALILGGDVATWALVSRVRALDGTCRIFNHYGPTETTVGACMIEATDDLHAAGDAAVPIGPPLAGYRVEIVDDAGRLLPAGAEGEIRISGPAVAAGYTQPESAGAARFGCTDQGVRSYLTGDLGRLRPDGAVMFLGRKDDMVKVRGHRVDPVGLADLIRSHPGVRDAVVLVERHAEREPVLVAAAAGDVEACALAAWFAEQVPPAMRPARLTVHATLPLTANGKIDRGVLLAPAAAVTEVPEPPVPRAPGDTLDMMCGMWRTVLGCAEVRPDDDFFALGGDSIVAIQLVGRARAAGLHITPTQIFETATPRGLAALARPVGRKAAGRPAVYGPIPLTPIQSWFMDIAMPARDHWSLTAVFEGPPGCTGARLETAVQTLLGRHDALRLRLDTTGDRPCQRVARDAPRAAAITVDGRDLDEEALHALEAALADRLIGDLDLASGRVFGAGLIGRGPGLDSRIVFAAHHFVFDLVSWMIIADEVGACLADGPDAVSTVPTAWSWWASAVAGRVDGASGERAYWEEVARNAEFPIPLDHPGAPNREGDAAELKLALDAETTERLLAGAFAAYGLRAHETAMAVVGRALVVWAGSGVTLDLEGHGREPFDPSIDLTRTIGWFTVRYPVNLAEADAADPRRWLIAAKETARSVPNRGVGYGLLRCSGRTALLEPAISFNFVGALDQFGTRSLRLLRVGAGRERTPLAERPHLLAFDCWLDGGRLTVRCRFGPRHSAATVSGLLHAVGEEAATLADHCTQTRGTVYTPSDFSGMDFSQDELDQLTDEVHAAE